MEYNDNEYSRMYLHLKKLADHARMTKHAKYVEYEMKCAEYGYKHEDKIWKGSENETFNFN